MAGSYLGQALIFLTQVVFGLYLLAALLRFLLQIARADFYNPVSQFLVTITNPPLRFLRRLIPGYGGIDWASIALIVLVQAAEIGLVSLIAAGTLPGPGGFALLTLGQLLQFIIYVYIFAVLAQVILSWVNPDVYHPATVLLYSLTEPLLRPARRLVPLVAGLDLSPIVVLVVLNLLLILIASPLIDAGSLYAGRRLW